VYLEIMMAFYTTDYPTAAGFAQNFKFALLLILGIFQTSNGLLQNL
jgi:hypothetical protein